MTAIDEPAPSDPEFDRHLGGEVELWFGERVVDAATARRILSRYRLGIPSTIVDPTTRGRLSGIVGMLGAILTGLGVLLFVASNWQALDRVTKIGLLIGAIVLAHGLAFLARARGRRRTSAALVFVGTLVYAASVYLVGQMYHLVIGDPLLPLLVALGGLPVALLATSRPSFAVVLAGFVLGYGELLQRWGAWNGPDPLVPLAFLGWGAATLAASEAAEMTDWARPFAMITRIAGAALISLVLSALGFTAMWRTFGDAAQRAREPELAVTLVIGLALAAVLALVPAWRSGWRAVPLGGALATLVLPGLVGLLIGGRPFAAAEPYAIVANALIALTVLWWVLVGLATGRESFVNLALVLFGVTAFARYFDFAFALLDRSFVFIGAGVLLLAGGYALERVRRRLLLGPAGAEVSHAG